MKLTPLDIQQHQFRSVLWGFDAKEVDAFLDLVSTAFEDLIRNNNEAQDELRRMQSSLDEFREREKTLKETLITATKIADDVKQGAQREAEAVISAAEVQAEKIIQNAHTRLVRIMDDINELKRQKAQFEGSLRSLVGTHGKLLDAMSEKVEAEALDITISRRPSTVSREPVVGDGKLAPLADDLTTRSKTGNR